MDWHGLMVEYGIPAFFALVAWAIRKYVKNDDMEKALLQLTHAAERAAREVEQTMRGPGMSEKKQAAAIGAVVHRLGGERGVRKVAKALGTPHGEMLSRIRGEVESAVLSLPPPSPSAPSVLMYPAPGGEDN